MGSEGKGTAVEADGIKSVVLEGFGERPHSNGCYWINVDQGETSRGDKIRSISVPCSLSATGSVGR